MSPIWLKRQHRTEKKRKEKLDDLKCSPGSDIKPQDLVIGLVLFYLLVVEGIESNPRPQTGSTHGNSYPRGGQRGRGCDGCGSGRGSRQDPIDDASAKTSVRDPAGLTLYLTLSIQITKSTVS